ncbi:MAG: hypothetical protein Q8L39_08580 [Burkholderiales bacterium]|nr:hypothetical protein [Burkholderiales bacterium]
MKFDKYKAFPYPVLRPESDDYKDGEFQATVEFVIAENNIKAAIGYALSAEEITDEIAKGNAEYVCMISCRDTYFQQVISSSERKMEANFDIGALRGEVRVNPYVVVKKDIAAYTSPDINAEFGPGPFQFVEGDVLAQDEAQIFYIDRDLFKPITSVFDLVKKDDLVDGIWTVGFEESHIQIEVSPKMKEAIDAARNDHKKRIVLLNSIYFAAVMQAVQKLKNPNENFDGKKWAEVIRRQAHNKGLNLDSHDAYLITEHLMQQPIMLLDAYVFKGGNL